VPRADRGPGPRTSAVAGHVCPIRGFRRVLLRRTATARDLWALVSRMGWLYLGSRSKTDAKDP